MNCSPGLDDRLQEQCVHRVERRTISMNFGILVPLLFIPTPAVALPFHPPPQSLAPRDDGSSKPNIFIIVAPVIVGVVFVLALLGASPFSFLPCSSNNQKRNQFLPPFFEGADLTPYDNVCL